MSEKTKDWIAGRITLAAAAGWSSGEIRMVSDLGYWLAEQGKTKDALLIFEGLVAIAPATHYFDGAIGALRLREKEFEKARFHLDAALRSDPSDAENLFNRALALLGLGEIDDAKIDLRKLCLGKGDLKLAKKSEAILQNLSAN